MNAYSNENKVVSGVVAKSIEIACREFEKKLNVQWESYVVTISETENYHVIVFSSKDVPVELRGSPDGMPGFEIKIKKSNYEISESQFIR
ncbi:hypothetical protein MNBD_GAMMA16-788 [hydrothermal vent metagenome]|uniref:Uncharacterized protein n=1 Tax=hydrothermal vent metagenome TaxID=652676 RepID=A0A3B0Z106_9ZZZZ